MATVAYDIIERPIITEKSASLFEMKKYTLRWPRTPTRSRSPRPSRRSSA